MTSEWQKVLLGDLCKFTKGTSATLKTLPGEYPLIVTGPEPLSSSDYQFEGEAVCVPMVSSTGHGHASLKRVHYASGRFAVANIVTACEVKDPAACSTRFLHIYLQHFKDELIVPRMQGTANVSLSRRELALVPVELPPMAEQQRIVEIVDSLASAAEAVDALTDSCHDLLGAEVSRLYAEAPLVRIDEVASVLSGFAFKSAEFSLNSQHKRLLRNDNVGTGRIEWENVRHLPPNKEQARHDRYDLAVDDVVVSLNRPIIKSGTKASVVTQEDLPCYLVQRVARVRLSEPLHLPLVLASFHSAAFRNYVELVQKSAGHVPMLSANQIGEFMLPDPRSLGAELELIAAIIAMEEAARLSVSRADEFRTQITSALLSGARRIPEMYDELMGA